MTGLDKIIKVLKLMPRLVERILNEAKEEEDKIISLAKEEASMKSVRLTKSPHQKQSNFKPHNHAKLIRRQMDAKLTMINEIILKLNMLTSLPDTEYFDIGLQIVIACS